MNANVRVQEAMLQRVADALGKTLLREVAFVGGSTTGLLVTDPFTREAIRYTEDVDLIVHIVGLGPWYNFNRVLDTLGFFTSPHDDVSCRKRLRDGRDGDLIVDFMPDDAAILGYSNRWYNEALQQATDYALASGTIIRVVTPPYFLGTKLEAWRGRGNNDPLASRDVEDILNVLDGRPSLLDEMAEVDLALRRDVADGIAGLLGHRDFPYVVQAAARNNRQHEELLFRRLEALARIPD
jgi:predicted nucleotidyltransferase